jgi:hypothetical protein
MSIVLNCIIMVCISTKIYRQPRFQHYLVFYCCGVYKRISNSTTKEEESSVPLISSAELFLDRKVSSDQGYSRYSMYASGKRVVPAGPSNWAGLAQHPNQSAAERLPTIVQ